MLICKEEESMTDELWFQQLDAWDTWTFHPDGQWEFGDNDPSNPDENWDEEDS